MLKYSAKYFNKTSKIIKNVCPNNKVTLQFFQRKNNVVFCGINEVLEMLKHETNVSKYQIKYLPENTIINNKDVVLELEGPYQEFGEYEGIIDGILSRASSLATNARKIVDVANKKSIIFMGDRADHYINQEKDGYAIYMGGIKDQVTDAQIELHDGNAVGTVPHVLIQMFKGDIVEALTAYSKTFPDENLTALVDYNNDVISDSLKAYKAFPDKLKAVRVDTSEGVSDAMFLNNEEYGVTPNMIKTLRSVLDNAGANKVKIIVSSGFDFEKIKNFETQGAPVDVYGVGASLLKLNVHFTGDAVKINDKKHAKIGRAYGDASKLLILK